MEKEYTFFKFRAINKNLIDSLVDPSLYFAKPDRLNDPFDCRINLRKCFEQAIKKAEPDRAKLLTNALNKPTFFDDWKKGHDEIGVCSFSNNAMSPLLWSHYADEHKGVCLLYGFEKEFLNDRNVFIGMSSVVYGQNVVTDWLQTALIDPHNPKKFLIELIKIYQTTKGEDWGYEKEDRIIRREAGRLAIPAGSLLQVCFGLRTPQEDIDLITKLARDYSGCTTFCRMVHGDTDFGLEMEDI